MTLTEFLLARIAADEAAARAGISGQADPENGWGLVDYDAIAGLTLSPHVDHIHERVQGEHIIHWHPYRVLAECEAKRRIVETRPVEVLTENPQAWRLHDHVLRLLALPYVDHPDFREEWRA